MSKVEYISGDLIDKNKAMWYYLKVYFQWLGRYELSKQYAEVLSKV